jgi:hypothetical protein
VLFVPRMLTFHHNAGRCLGRHANERMVLPAQPVLPASRARTCWPHSTQRAVLDYRWPRNPCEGLARAIAVDQHAAPSPAPAAPRGSHWAIHKFGGTCMATADRIRAAAELVISTTNATPGAATCVVVSAMGSHPTTPAKVTDLILNMIKKAAKQDAAFLVDLASLQEKHVETAKLLLGQSAELTQFVSNLLDDIANLKAMLQAMSIGGRTHKRDAACCGWAEIAATQVRILRTSP